MRDSVHECVYVYVICGQILVGVLLDLVVHLSAYKQVRVKYMDGKSYKAMYYQFTNKKMCYIVFHKW